MFYEIPSISTPASLKVASHIVGLLPPLAQSAREMQALLSDARLYQALGSGEAIREIVRNENGYAIVTEHHTLQVDIHYLHTGKIGPAQFMFEFHEPQQNS